MVLIVRHDAPPFLARSLSIVLLCSLVPPPSLPPYRFPRLSPPPGLPLRYPTDFYYDDGIGQHLNTNNTGYVLRFNRLIGGARMRQVTWEVVGGGVGVVA